MDLRYRALTLQYCVPYYFLEVPIECQSSCPSKTTLYPNPLIDSCHFVCRNNIFELLKCLYVMIPSYLQLGPSANPSSRKCRTALRSLPAPAPRWQGQCRPALPTGQKFPYLEIENVDDTIFDYFRFQGWHWPALEVLGKSSTKI